VGWTIGGDLGLIPMAALALHWASGQSTTALLAISIAEALSLLGLAAQVVLYARPELLL
jgi:hypothetical protein